MARKEKILKVFVPAQALEHAANGETFNTREKIINAVHRYHQNKNFDDLVTIQDPMPFVFIEKYTLDKVNIGYNVVAKLLI